MPKHIPGFILLILVIGSVLIFSSCAFKNDAYSDNSGSEMSMKSDNFIPDDKALDNNTIAFVQQDYFYNDTVYIEIKSNKPCDIFYTMDGSEPDRTRELYRDKIKLTGRF